MDDHVHSERLFVELVHRVRHYADAMFLFGMLKEHADVREFESTRPKMSRRQMENMVTDREVRRSLERLQERGLIKVRTHANTRTHVAVNRDAVLDLLRQPVSPRLPGLHEFNFPFLDAWQADIEAGREAEATPSADVSPDASVDPFPDSETPPVASM